MAAVVAQPRWVGLLLLLSAVSLVASAALLTTDVGKQALVDQWERTSIAFGRPVDDARYAELQDLSARFAVPYGAATTVASRPLAALALAGLIYGFFALRGSTARFTQVVAVVVHAGVILALRDVIAAPLNYIRESIGSPLTLIRLFSMLDEASPIARFFALIDVFVLWWLVVLAIGIAVLYQKRIRTVVLGCAGTYVIVAMVLALAMAVLGGTT